MVARHVMVRVTPTAWSRVIAMRPDLAGDPLVVDWANAGNPLIARRHNSDDPAGLVPLGLPLPPAQGKRRISVALSRDDITSIAPPPLLADAVTVAPVHWHASIHQFLALSPATHVFGSLAWQYLTGLPYLAETSDLDLLWPLPPRDKLDALLAGIAQIAATAPMRIDGEIIGPLGGVNWRELRESGADELLLKGQKEVRMVPRQAFLAGGAV